MAHSFISNYMHCVFSTRGRLALITPELQPRLWAYIGGIARENGMKAIAVGGIADHIHVLLSLPATISFAKAVQLIKGGSSKWVHEEFPRSKDFGWQDGYAAFSVSRSQLDKTADYINNQKEHHRKRSFQEEFIELLDKHGIEYDARYVFR
jgi:REP element-mobilizing transposase RayT